MSRKNVFPWLESIGNISLQKEKRKPLAPAWQRMQARGKPKGGNDRSGMRGSSLIGIEEMGGRVLLRAEMVRENTRGKKRGGGR